MIKSKSRVADHGEVFTPTWMVAAMLDLVKDESERIDSRFLEPACGTGNFLVQILKRKLVAVDAAYGATDLQRRQHAILALACIYGIELLADNVAECRANMLTAFAAHLAVNESDEIYLAASQILSQNIVQGDTLTMRAKSGETIEFLSQPFDVIISNPPYQRSDGGFGRSAAPIYHHFVEQAKAMMPRYLTMIIPARWFAGGKGLDAFRKSMLRDDRLRSMDDYLCVSDVFPGVGLKGGVHYFLWDRDNPGLCRVTTHHKKEIVSAAIRPLYEDGLDVFIRLNEGLSILKKVVAIESNATESNRFDQLVSPRKPFGLETKFRGTATQSDGDLLVYQNGGEGYTPRIAISKGIHLIDKWKVFVNYSAPGTGNKDTYPHRIISTPFLGEPGSISSETYLCIGPFDSKSVAESVWSYLSCRLIRLLILLHRPSKDATRKVYAFVPTQTWTKQWTDADLYEKYGISAEEIAFIEKMVRPMELSAPCR